MPHPRPVDSCRDPADLARILLARGARTLLVDGRSGSGKTTLAGLVAEAWPGSVVLHLDDVYPGWDGLAAASEHLGDAVLAPRAAGADARWLSWDWAAQRPGSWHPVPPERPLVVEGAGSLTARHRALADAAVWVEAPDDVRRERALARDGATYAPHWDRWAAQEEEFASRAAPREHADVLAVPVPGGFRLGPPDVVAPRTAAPQMVATDPESTR